MFEISFKEEKKRAKNEKRLCEGNIHSNWGKNRSTTGQASARVGDMLSGAEESDDRAGKEMVRLGWVGAEEGSRVRGRRSWWLKLWKPEEELRKTGVPSVTEDGEGSRALRVDEKNYKFHKLVFVVKHKKIRRTLRRAATLSSSLKFLFSQSLSMEKIFRASRIVNGNAITHPCFLAFVTAQVTAWALQIWSQVK